jgi:hypothetical protein
MAPINGVSHVVDQDVIDEDACKARGDDARHQQQQSGEQRVNNAGLVPGDAFAQQPQQARPGSDFLEIRARLESEHHPGKGLVEFAGADRPRPGGRIIQPYPRSVVAGEPLDHHEVIEIPEHDVGAGELRKLRHIFAQSLCDHAGTARRAQQVDSLGPIATDAAHFAQFLKRGPTAIGAENHRKTRRPAFHGLLLHDGWDAHTTPG